LNIASDNADYQASLTAAKTRTPVSKGVIDQTDINGPEKLARAARRWWIEV
jgi:hypothetical protein